MLESARLIDIYCLVGRTHTHTVVSVSANPAIFLAVSMRSKRRFLSRLSKGVRHATLSCVRGDDTSVKHVLCPRRVQELRRKGLRPRRNCKVRQGQEAQ